MQKPIKNVSSTTAVDLKAELAQHVDQFEKMRSSSGKQVTARRPDKKPTVWSRQNKGVNDRNQRDMQVLPAVESDVLARSREQLEKKARFYEAMQSGQFEYDPEDEDNILVDFDRKYLEEKDAEKKSRKKKRVEEEDPWVEYEDEFGRTRVVRKSQLPQREEEVIEDEIEAPVYDFSKSDRTNMNHFEADREIRTKGVGFYQFSKDEDERQAQMDKLNKIRQETENARKSVVSAASKRKQMMAQNAEKIRARKAALQAKRHHQLKPEQLPDVNPVVNEDSVTNFLKSIRDKV
ncbi:hypothetical protein A0J61_00758 [Choanephora cucurbitarum]|uniref:CCDC174 alpha/beta GRSR domain-containing protein n=1 Tax=Choanephora cucurbitarum TaxID=101091 RepID=A0A1C7NQ79_9FUNG|nr:hypothetical protein A0J61_00758 [Choanephora cucurbitarum]